MVDHGLDGEVVEVSDEQFIHLNTTTNMLTARHVYMSEAESKVDSWLRLGQYYACRPPVVNWL